LPDLLHVRIDTPDNVPAINKLYWEGQSTGILAVCQEVYDHAVRQNTIFVVSAEFWKKVSAAPNQ
jgi:hypothetical protein